MLLKQTIAAACLLAIGANAMTKGQELKAIAKAKAEAKKAAARAIIVQQKLDFDTKRNANKALKHEQIDARQAEVAAKQAERQAHHDAWWARVSPIIEAKKQKKKYAELKQLQRDQKKNFALQKVLDLAAKREAHKNRQQQQDSRVLLKELRKVQKEAWKALNAQQKANYEALDATEKANWAQNRADEIEAFNKNIEDWETEDQRQKAAWDHIMAHQQLHWAAKVSGLYEGGSTCSMGSGPDFNPLYEAEEFDHGLDISSYDEADVQVGAVSFTHSANGGFYILVSTDKHNALYEVFTKQIAGQEGTSTKTGYSEHTKARNFQAINDADTISDTDAYNLRMVAIADVDGSQFNWAICYNRN